MAAQLDITIARNETWARTFQVCDGDGNPVDITGTTLAGQVKSRTDNDATVASFTCAIFNAANGEFSVKLDATEGSALNGYGSPIQTENLAYDIRWTAGGGTKIDLVRGKIVLLRGVTQG